LSRSAPSSARQILQGLDLGRRQSERAETVGRGAAQRVMVNGSNAALDAAQIAAALAVDIAGRRRSPQGRA